MSLSLVEFLEMFYAKYNDKEKAKEDPVYFLHRFDDIRAREIIGIVAASLAFGRVSQIIKSIEKVVAIMEDNPRDFLLNVPEDYLMAKLKGFKHRWVKGSDIVSLLYACKILIARYGSLESLYEHCKARDLDPAVSFAVALRNASPEDISVLIPDPGKNSPCKRLRLFLKWMVRKDNVDPGGWTVETPADLVVPLDVHMWKFGKELGWIKRASPDVKAAIELTQAFRLFRPDDPLRYDFALSHLGMEAKDYREVISAVKKLSKTCDCEGKSQPLN
ncbi:TIGR02757 family protein [Acetomicrobium thermoterrenum DSM 13490]|uniref:TIGR02757 family protein n=2 Tax=Acetomicrobium TaxID=49894 RepID=A0A1H3H9L9_9BACT|nr:TIGR02757 family protein [Acetomicrobium thermoterrenum DSM 13490]